MNHDSQLIINLGCGNKKEPGEVGVDIIPTPEVDIVADLNKYPLPFADNSVDIVRSSHCFEHLDDLVALMEDIHRMLKPGGILEFTVPHVSNIEFFRDPTHKHAFTLGTMDYFVRGIKPITYTNIEFEYLSRKLAFGKGLRGKIGSFLASLSERRYEKYYCWKYPCTEIVYRLRALKP
ncbi:MAG: methyltransferase domain-containing protein [Gammaproteobacteria bacterium]|nr:methyltransferase domain-containing protein [Gammaproteobacteria bacterium]